MTEFERVESLRRLHFNTEVAEVSEYELVKVSQRADPNNLPPTDWIELPQHNTPRSSLDQRCGGGHRVIRKKSGGD